MSLSVASNWLWNFGIAYTTPYIVNSSSTGVDGFKAADLRGTYVNKKLRIAIHLRDLAMDG